MHISIIAAYPFTSKEHVNMGIYLRERVIIMAQQQHAADVYPDELSPPNKRYDLMDANKKVDLEHVRIIHREQEF
ncbi:hypothetical protein Tco_0251116 [Tanacetum coccineum]